MLIDTTSITSLEDAAATAASAEAAGYDAWWTVELNHDPFFPLALAAPATSQITLGTAIAVAFARNPMTLANIGWDLNALSNGRFVMGLGSQIKPHITKRFSMEWSRPASRMREMVQAMHAIWNSWGTGDQLRFKGDFYTHTLMTPLFNPGPNPGGIPQVFLAGVGPLMTKVAGEVADGFFAHPFTTPSFLTDVTLPALAEGRAAAERTDSIDVSLAAFIVTGGNEEEMAASATACRRQLSFYGSTPAYRPVLDHHGWGDMQDELNAMSKRGEWEAMADVITDDILEAFAIVEEPQHVASEVRSRFGDKIDRLSFNTMAASNPAVFEPILAELKEL